MDKTRLAVVFVHGITHFFNMEMPASGPEDVRAATAGSSDLFAGASNEGLPNDCSKGFGSREKWLLKLTAMRSLGIMPKMQNYHFPGWLAGGGHCVPNKEADVNAKSRACLMQ